MATDQVSTGVSVTVDVTDIKHKFIKSVDELNASLTKSQKKLGLFYNEQGLLTNALGQNVEGLSLASIKLGQYVDDLGRVRTFQDGFTEGLNKSHQEMGYYVDDLGNIRNRLGEVIAQTEKARKAEEAQAQAAQLAAAKMRENSIKTLESFNKMGQGIASTAGHLAQFQELLLQIEGDADGSTQSLAFFASAVSVAGGSFQASLNLFQGLTTAVKTIPALFNTVAVSASTAAPAVAKLGATAQATGASFAALGGPITIALAAITAVGVGVASYKTSQRQTEDLSDSFKELEKRAKAAGRSIQEVKDALEVGAFRAQSGNALLDAATELKDAKTALSDATKAYKDAQKQFAEAQRNAGTGGAGFGAAPTRAQFNLDKLDETYKNAIAKYNDITEEYVAAAKKAQETEVDKLTQQRTNYAALLKVAEKVGNDENADIFRRQVELIDKQIKDIREKEKSEADKAREAAKAEAIASAGIADYLKAAKDAAANIAPSFDNLDATLENWNKLVKEGTLTQAEVNGAADQLKAKLKGELYKDIGLELPKADAAQSAFDRLKVALDKEVISQEEYNKAVADLTKATKEAALKEIGIEPQEPPALDFSEKKRRLDDLLIQETINQAEYNAALSDLKTAARSAVKGLASIGKQDFKFEDIEKSVKAFQKNADLSALEKLRDQVADAAQREFLAAFVEAENALKQGIIKDKERDAIIDAAYKDLAKAREAQAQAARQELVKTRQKLGIDNLLEQLKTPLDRYKETLKEIQAAAKEGAITKSEKELLKANAFNKYREERFKNDDFKELEIGDKASKGKEIAQSYGAGSESLYVAQVRNATTNYQSNMQSAVAALRSTSAETLNQNRLMAEYLDQIANRPAVGVWV